MGGFSAPRNGDWRDVGNYDDLHPRFRLPSPASGRRGRPRKRLRAPLSNSVERRVGAGSHRSSRKGRS
jgi:hypothetical protein